MNFIHISNLTIEKKQTKDIMLGPWCDGDSFFKSTKGFIFDGIVSQEELENRSSYCNIIIDEFIVLVANSLNSYHNEKYSIEFWRILLANWLTSVVNNLHYYYTVLSKIDTTLTDQFYIEVDASFHYNDIRDPYLHMHSQEYIHSLVSFLVYRMNISNVKIIQKNIIKSKIKKNSSDSFLKRMIWRILDRKHANMVVFGVAGMKKIEIIKIFIKNNFISFSKPKIKDKHIDARIYKDRHLIVEKPKDCFSGILIDFINENIPTPLIERFEFMVNNYNNHRNADCFVASPGLYDDEQLFELAMGRYNGARIVNVHEAGNGLDKFSCSSNFLYKPFDMYYSWGYLSHVGYDEFKSAPSRLSVIKNAHNTEFQFSS